MECNVTPTSIQGTKEKTRHTTTPIQRIVKRSTIVQNEIQRQDNTWAVALKKSPNKWNPAQAAMQRNHHSLVDHEDFSHQLTSIN